ncbi:MAG: PAS domain-containing protein [Desulfobacterales bacterium]|nr:PAS domain-containing protein [Desulfobacterales bacterium]
MGKSTIISGYEKNIKVRNKNFTQLESALRKNKERLELAIIASDAGLWDWDIPTGKLVLGEKWCEILGYIPGEIEEHISSWEKLIYPDDKETTLKKINSHLNGETRDYRTEHRLQSKNGNWTWVLDMGKVVERDSLGHPVRMTGIKIDINKRKQMEKELEKFNCKLEKMVEERTRQLRNKRKLLEKKTRELKNKSNHLEEANTALKLLLRKSDENKKEIEENMLANIKELIDPYLEKMDQANLNDTQRTSLEIIKSNLQQIISPFSKRLTSKYLNLTPAEINVANLIKHGKTSKEIANLMCLSVRTIDTQRRSIRKKLGLCSKDINLETYLHSLV